MFAASDQFTPCSSPPEGAERLVCTRKGSQGGGAGAGGSSRPFQVRNYRRSTTVRVHSLALSDESIFDAASCALIRLTRLVAFSTAFLLLALDFAVSPQ